MANFCVKWACLKGANFSIKLACVKCGKLLCKMGMHEMWQFLMLFDALLKRCSQKFSCLISDVAFCFFLFPELHMTWSVVRITVAEFTPTVAWFPSTPAMCLVSNAFLVSLTTVHSGPVSYQSMGVWGGGSLGVIGIFFLFLCLCHIFVVLLNLSELSK